MSGRVDVRPSSRPGVALIVMDRPEARHALDASMVAQLEAALDDLMDQPEILVVVLTGSGDRAFCAGMDLAAFRARNGRDLRPDRPLERLRRGTYPKPLVAAVNGPAVGAGFEIVLACDLAVAAEHATFAVPEVRRGIFAAGCSTKLAARLPRALAMELTLVGAPIGAGRALELGLVNRVVPAQALIEAALDLAAQVAANAPLAVQATKQVVHAVAAGAIGSYESVDALAVEVASSADALEGATAFVEKRPPVWTGR